MNSNRKYIGIGLLIGGGIAIILIAGIFIAGLIPLSSTPAPTAALEAPEIIPVTLEPLPTFTPTPIFISTPIIPTIQDTSSPESDREAILAGQILHALSNYGGEWHILIREAGVRNVFAFNADRKNHIASMIKLPFAMLFFRTLEEKGMQPSEYADYLSTHGIGRTYMQLLRAMLVESEEAAAKTLTEFIRDSKLDTQAALNAWGATHTDLSSRYSTPEDVAALYENLYFNNAIDPEGRRIILDLLSTYTPNDDTRLGVIRALLPQGGMFYNKRGSVTAGRLIIGDSALLTWNQNGQEKAYMIVALAYNDSTPTTDVKLVRGIEEIAHIFWNYAMP